MKNMDTIEYAIKRKKVLTVKMYSYLGRERAYIDSVLERYLQEVGLNRLFNNVSYCIHEIAGNAHKANLKRHYFDQNNLNIENPNHYKNGMKHFKREVLRKPEDYTMLLKEFGYYIKFHFQIDGSYFKVVVRNNVPLTFQEKRKIDQKFEVAKDATNLADVYAVSEDYTEGAGLGIVMLLIILKNLGFSATPFHIYSKDGETFAFLNLDITKTELLEERYAELMVGTCLSHS